MRTQRKNETCGRQLSDKNWLEGDRANEHLWLDRGFEKQPPLCSAQVAAQSRIYDGSDIDPRAWDRRERGRLYGGAGGVAQSVTVSASRAAGARVRRFAWLGQPRCRHVGTGIMGSARQI